MMNTLVDWIQRLQQSNKLVIVEGKKDLNALNRLGIRNVLTLNKPLFAVVEEVASLTNECVVLTDLDREGRELYSRLSKNLRHNGVKVDDGFRNFLFKNTKLRQIEGMTRMV